MVAAKQPLAAAAGVEMLRQGGSAVDAAVATSLACGVVEPYMSGIGGGGLALYMQSGGAPRALHFSMRAPESARPDMYEIVPDTLDRDLFGWPSTRGSANIHGPRSIAIPGLVPGLRQLWEAGGRLPWSEVVRPAIRLAGDGYPIDWMSSLRTLEGFDLLSRYTSSASVFLPHGRPTIPDLGLGPEILRQPDLAGTLEAVAADPDVLGKGDIADSISETTRGRVTPGEMAEQRPSCGEPLTFAFHDYDVHLVPWATGGATVMEWLGIVKELDPPADAADPRYWWACLKAGEVALHDRLTRLADPAFEPFPEEILDAGYLRRMGEAIRSGEVDRPELPPDVGSTTHLSAVDSDGNSVALTQTLLSLWGSGMVAPGTGVCLNNGMMWFDPEPGRPNSIAGGKLPLANMCPVMVTRSGEPVLVYGASGGRRIMTAVVQILMRVALLGETLQAAMVAPRIDITMREIKADVRIDAGMCAELSRLMGCDVIRREPVLGASPWASPVGLQRLEDGSWTGAGDPFTMACALEP